MLFGGSDPLDALRTASSCGRQPGRPRRRRPDVRDGGVEIAVVPLWGHSARQVGYLIDGVLFSADVLLPETALAKYPIPYIFSLTDHQASLDSLARLTFDVAVPGHGSSMTDSADRLGANQDAVDRVHDAILDAVRQPSPRATSSPTSPSAWGRRSPTRRPTTSSNPRSPPF
jgi:glyoxylase-like metal-dependent hydrolase (beta-lactamase superfamily II)